MNSYYKQSGGASALDWAMEQVREEEVSGDPIGDLDSKKEDSLTEDDLKEYLIYHIKELVDVNVHELYDFWYERIEDEHGNFIRWSDRPVRTQEKAREMAQERKAKEKVDKWVDNQLRNITDPVEKQKKINQIKRDYHGGFLASWARGSRFLEKRLPITNSILSAYRKKGKKGKQSKKKKGSKEKKDSKKKPKKKKATKHSKKSKQGGGKSRKPKKAKQTRRKPKRSRLSRRSRLAGYNPYPNKYK